MRIARLYEKFKIYGVTNRINFKTSRPWHDSRRHLLQTWHQPVNIFQFDKKAFQHGCSQRKVFKALKAKNSQLND